MNLANKLTFFRIFLAAVFMRLLFVDDLWARVTALAVFLLASLTDYWDGRIARTRNQITALGKLMDPIADKLLTLSAFIGFVQLGIVAGWMVVVILLRDLMITGVRLGFGPTQIERVGARNSGKHKTVLQMTVIIAILIGRVLERCGVWDQSWKAGADIAVYWGMLAVIFVTLTSGLWYLWINRALLFSQEKG